MRRILLIAILLMGCSDTEVRYIYVNNATNNVNNTASTVNNTANNVNNATNNVNNTTVEPYCGDGVKGDTERCDGEDQPRTCDEFGFDGGVVSCTEECEIDISTCFDSCGTGEFIDFENDPENCGACENNCNWGEIWGEGEWYRDHDQCIAGVCEAFEECDGTIYKVYEDNEYLGEIKHECCDGVVTRVAVKDSYAFAANCGSCGVQCGHLESCYCDGFDCECI